MQSCETAQAAAAQALAAALPRMTEAVGRINRLFAGGHRQAAVAQFHALAAMAIRTPRDDLDCIGHVIHGEPIDISVRRIPRSRGRACRSRCSCRACSPLCR
jgi:hypothetical protein